MRSNLTIAELQSSTLLDEDTRKERSCLLSSKEPVLYSHLRLRLWALALALPALMAFEAGLKERWSGCLLPVLPNLHGAKGVSVFPTWLSSQR